MPDAGRSSPAHLASDACMTDANINVAEDSSPTVAHPSTPIALLDYENSSTCPNSPRSSSTSDTVQLSLSDAVPTLLDIHSAGPHPAAAEFHQLEDSTAPPVAMSTPPASLFNPIPTTPPNSPLITTATIESFQDGYYLSVIFNDDVEDQQPLETVMCIELHQDDSITLWSSVVVWPLYVCPQIFCLLLYVPLIAVLQARGGYLSAFPGNYTAVSQDEPDYPRWEYTAWWRYSYCPANMGRRSA